MNIGEEKAHIYSIMQDITAERRRLTDLYFGLKERLDELNKLEQRGLTELSLKGYVDLYNQVQQRTVEQEVHNIERESKYAIHNIKKESVQVQEEKTVIPNKVVQEAKEKEVKTRGKRSSYMNVDKIMGNIAFVLKESGRPMAKGDIYDKVNEMMNGTIGKQNFNNNILPRAEKRNKKIQKVMRGYYQYNING